MIKNAVGKISKNNISLVEYDSVNQGYSESCFIQSGQFGFWCTRQEIQDLYTVLNYYLNMENFLECKVVVDEQHISIQ